MGEDKKYIKFTNKVLKYVIKKQDNPDCLGRPQTMVFAFFSAL